MTKDNSFAYFQEVMVEKENKIYVVTLEEEEATFYLKQELVDNIEEKTGEDKNLIAILLAYIDYVRISRCKRNGKRDGRIPKLQQEEIVDGITVLLRKFSIEDVIMRFKSLKWHEIKTILTSEVPIEEFIQQS